MYMYIWIYLYTSALYFNVSHYNAYYQQTKDIYIFIRICIYIHTITHIYYIHITYTHIFKTNKKMLSMYNRKTGYKFDIILWPKLNILYNIT